MKKGMIRKLTLVASLALLALSLFFGGCTGKTDSGEKAPDTQTPETKTVQEPIELKYATYNSASHYMAAIDVEFIKRMDEQSNGIVKITPYWDGTLVKPTEYYQETVSGSADLVQGPAGGEKTRFPLNNANSYFTFGLKSSEAVRSVFTELYNTNAKLQSEYKEIKPMIWITAGDSWIHTTKKPIRKAEDMKGLNIRVADDPSFALVQSLGANPVRMPISEAYNALDKGIVDGIITGTDPLKTFKFAEVTKYSTSLPMWTPWLVSKVFNIDSWNKLPADVQKLFEDNSRWWEDQLLNVQGDMIKAGLDEAKARGNEIIYLSDEENAKIVTILEQNAEKAADAAGASDIFAQAKQLIQKYNK